LVQLPTYKKNDSSSISMLVWLIPVVVIGGLLLLGIFYVWRGRFCGKPWEHEEEDEEMLKQRGSATAAASLASAEKARMKQQQMQGGGAAAVPLSAGHYVDLEAAQPLMPNEPVIVQGGPSIAAAAPVAAASGFMGAQLAEEDERRAKEVQSSSHDAATVGQKKEDGGGSASADAVKFGGAAAVAGGVAAALMANKKEQSSRDRQRSWDGGPESRVLPQYPPSHFSAHAADKQDGGGIDGLDGGGGGGRSWAAEPRTSASPPAIGQIPLVPPPPQPLPSAPLAAAEGNQEQSMYKQQSYQRQVQPPPSLSDVVVPLSIATPTVIDRTAGSSVFSLNNDSSAASYVSLPSAVEPAWPIEQPVQDDKHSAQVDQQRRKQLQSHGSGGTLRPPLEYIAETGSASAADGNTPTPSASPGAEGQRHSNKEHMREVVRGSRDKLQQQQQRTWRSTEDPSPMDPEMGKVDSAPNSNKLDVPPMSYNYESPDTYTYQ
jgi:hypothetical protein